MVNRFEQKVRINIKVKIKGKEEADRKVFAYRWRG